MLKTYHVLVTLFIITVQIYFDFQSSPESQQKSTTNIMALWNFDIGLNIYLEYIDNSTIQQ